ncbi:MAG: hypothetical protein OXP66_18280 [Candidatus Tectomicrobia bacterium]|nr:hypothetical protein [Candidatus Tectomicrobia bacterium]
MTRIEFWSAVMGLLVAIVVMFNQACGRIDRMQAETGARFDTMFERMDRMQAETNARFAEVNARFDAQQAKSDTRVDAVNARFDAAQLENSRQHDALNRRFDELFEVLRAFEGRISRLEGRLGVRGDEGGAIDGP